MNHTQVLFLMLLLMAGCSTPHDEEHHEGEATQEATIITLTEEQVKNAGITIAAPQKDTMHTTLKVNGVVDVPPQNIVSVSFPLGGYLKTTHLLPGMHVNKGQVIGIIEDQSLVQLQQDYLVAVARLQYLQQEYDRQKELNQHQVSADKVFQQATADYTAQKVLVKALAEKLRLIGIDPAKLDESKISRSVPVYSPINGFVSKVNVNIGKFVSPTEVLFELINPDDMHAALTIFEKDMPKVKIGQQVFVSFVDEPDRSYECDIILVTRIVGADRSGIAHCHFETKPKTLLPGMFLNATIRIDNMEAITVPEEALVRYGGHQYLIRVAGERTYELIEVETGIRENGLLEVSSTTHDLLKEQVVVKNAYAILGAMKNKGGEEGHGH
jgi:cobalt-zinc-cadmium efflux system membrane fusion protein